MSVSSFSTGDLLREAHSLADRAQDRIIELESRQAEVAAEIRELRAYVRRIRPDPTKRSPGRPKGGKGDQRRAGRSTVRLIAQIIDKLQDDASFSVGDLVEKTGRNPGSVHRAIRELREREAIRAAEKRKVGNAPQPTQFYKVMDRKTLREIGEGNG